MRRMKAFGGEVPMEREEGRQEWWNGERGLGARDLQRCFCERWDQAVSLPGLGDKGQHSCGVGTEPCISAPIPA